MRMLAGKTWAFVLLGVATIGCGGSTDAHNDSASTSSPLEDRIQASPQTTQECGVKSWQKSEGLKEYLVAGYDRENQKIAQLVFFYTGEHGAQMRVILPTEQAGKIYGSNEELSSEVNRIVRGINRDLSQEQSSLALPSYHTLGTPSGVSMGCQTRTLSCFVTCWCQDFDVFGQPCAGSTPHRCGIVNN